MTPFDGPPFALSRAVGDDADAIAALINREFAAAECWFVEGDRTTPGEVRALLVSPGGVFYIATDEGALAGCVYAEQRTERRGYIGLLAVDASWAGRGIGSSLMQKAEQHLSAAECSAIDITVVNLRTPLFSFYARLGYRVVGTLPFPRPSKRPCHLVRMSKELGAVG